MHLKVQFLFLISLILLLINQSSQNDSLEEIILKEHARRDTDSEKFEKLKIKSKNSTENRPKRIKNKLKKSSNESEPEGASDMNSDNMQEQGMGGQQMDPNQMGQMQNNDNNNMPPEGGGGGGGGS